MPVFFRGGEGGDRWNRGDRLDRGGDARGASVQKIRVYPQNPWLFFWGWGVEVIDRIEVIDGIDGIEGGDARGAGQKIGAKNFSPLLNPKS